MTDEDLKVLRRLHALHAVDARVWEGIPALLDLAEEALRLRKVIRQTHANYCDEAYTGRGLHAPECLLYELDAAEEKLNAR